MELIYTGVDNTVPLMHDGAKGMKWYRRRYQNYDGSYTPLGRQHYGIGPPRKFNKNSSVEESLEINLGSKDKSDSSKGNNEGNKKDNKEGSKKDNKDKKNKNDKNDGNAEGGKNKDKNKITEAQKGIKAINSTTQDLADNLIKLNRMKRQAKKTPNYAAELSDDEIRRRISRMRLETEYNQLMDSKNSGKYDAAERRVQKWASRMQMASNALGLIYMVKLMRNK